ncbi:MAG TPA: acyl-CoA dehydrogenase family protein [Pyrinomonadaceae bacterium]|nr:acyl-CoA dehydrogenase family protein [Pyrinomonadaceae bacterium]
MSKNFDFNISLNQPPILENYNLFSSDEALKTAVEANGGAWNNEKAAKFGEILGKAEMLELGNLANKFTPVLKTHDRFGNRLDAVEFHPAYHELMRVSIENETHSLAWTSENKGKYVARSVLAFLKQQTDEGTSCPLTMTFAVVPSLKISEEIANEWLPKVLSNEYDPRFLPANGKRGATFGMAMTEPQGGSDVRVNITFAEKLNDAGEYEITGRKWFCSAPMSDAFLVLAQTEKGLSCFLMPRFKPNGERNALYFQRLKDKLGNKSNASAEVEFHGAYAKIIGEEGRGVANIMEMVRHTRLDCAVGSAATLRRAVAESIHHCKYRKAFGKLLIEQPLMQNLLADLALESEAATAFSFRLARGFDESENDESAKLFTRAATAIGKFWNCKRAVFAIGEAIEVLGGNGYVEDSVLARLYRDIPVNSIWEGSGNVQCLDVLRSMKKEPESIEAIFAELESARNRNEIYDKFLLKLKDEFSNLENLEFRARIIVEKFALLLQAKVLLETAPDFISEAFCISRLSENKNLNFGTLPVGVKVEKIIERSMVKNK